MALRKDKQKVLGEVFDEDRIRSFLQATAPEGVDEDFDLLEKAYRGMKAENFETFLTFFKEAGRDLNAKNPAGQSFLASIESHRQGAVYAEQLRQAGAK